ncbi:MAG: hypothetical protein ACOVOR_02370 [Rhabdochlamydiaceae bacterium]
MSRETVQNYISKYQSEAKSHYKLYRLALVGLGLYAIHNLKGIYDAPLKGALQLAFSFPTGLIMKKTIKSYTLEKGEKEEKIAKKFEFILSKLNDRTQSCIQDFIDHSEKEITSLEEELKALYKTWTNLSEDQLPKNIKEEDRLRKIILIEKMQLIRLRIEHLEQTRGNLSSQLKENLLEDIASQKDLEVSSFTRTPERSALTKNVTSYLLSLNKPPVTYKNIFEASIEKTKKIANDLYLECKERLSPPSNPILSNQSSPIDQPD